MIQCLRGYLDGSSNFSNTRRVLGVANAHHEVVGIQPQSTFSRGNTAIDSVLAGFENINPSSPDSGTRVDPNPAAAI